MTLISNNDQILLLLRQQLKSLSERKDISRKNINRVNVSNKNSVQRVKSLALLEELPDEDLERTFIQGLLVDELGEAIINDPKFQKVVDQVVQIITSEKKSKSLLKQATEQLLN